MSDKRKRAARLIQDLVEESTGARPSYCATLNYMERARETQPLTPEEIAAAGGTASEAIAARIIARDAGRVPRAPRRQS